MPPKRPPIPKQVAAQYEKCAQIIRRGSPTQALLMLSQLRQARPDDPQGAALVGEAQSKLGRHAEAIDAYDQAVRLDPGNPGLRLNLADACRHGGQYERALENYQLVLKTDPKSIEVSRAVASVLIDLGREGEAAEIIRPLLDGTDRRRLRPNDRLYVAITGARIAPRHIDAELCVPVLEEFAPDARCTTHARLHGFNFLGRLREKAGDYDGAFEAYKAANEIDQHPWDADLHSKRIDDLIACWRSGRDIPSFVGVPKVGIPRHVFIVGMMRSGTTLTEQMVAMADDVTPGGELNAISRAVSQADPASVKFTRPMPTTRTKYTQNMINAMRHHADTVYARFAPAELLTDKQPTNYLYVPLIARLYPNARIIHCIRDARDCCVSNYQQAFNRPHPFTEDLERIGRYYRDYERLMDAWHELGDAPMLDLRYEELVADPEGQSKRVFEFLGLPWSERVLEFHRSERSVATASRQQVRQPIYTSSVAKWERYSAHLGPLNEALGLP
ncbi:MAG: sulfotransferase [Phycisphaerales bacterium]